MKAIIASTFHIPATYVWDTVQKSQTLIYITKGFLRFNNAEHFPKKWIQGKTEKSKLLFFGFIPGWQHTLEFIEIDKQKQHILTNEAGGFIRQWDHLIKVTDLTPTTCHYSDEIDINAGLLTPVIWLYAHIFYRYRQHRWKKLIRTHNFQVL